MKHRFALRRIPHEHYPLAIVEIETGAIVGRYYATSEKSARDHCAKLNGGKCRAKLEKPFDSDLSVMEAIDKARDLGDSTEGDGLKRLLWRLAILLEKAYE